MTQAGWSSRQFDERVLARGIKQEGDSLHLRAAVPLQPLVIAIALTRGSAGDGTPLPPPPPGTLAADRLMQCLFRRFTTSLGCSWVTSVHQKPSCMHRLRARCPPYHVAHHTMWRILAMNSLLWNICSQGRGEAARFTSPAEITRIASTYPPPLQGVVAGARKRQAWELQVHMGIACVQAGRRGRGICPSSTTLQWQR